MSDNQQLLCSDTGINMVYNRIGVCGDFGPNKKNYDLGVTQPIGSKIWRLKGDLDRDGFKKLSVSKAQRIMLITLFQILVNLNERAKQDALFESVVGSKEYRDTVQALQGEVDFMQERIAEILPKFDSDDLDTVFAQYKGLRHRYAYYISGDRPWDSKREYEIRAVNRYCGNRVQYDGSFMYNYAKMVYRHTEFGNYELSRKNEIRYGLGCDARRSIYDTRSGRRTIEMCKLIEAVKMPGYGADLYAHALLKAINERDASYAKLVNSVSH